MIRKILRWIGYVLLTPILLFIILFILLYIPPIQNFLREKVVTIASETTGMQIGIKRISLSFPLNLLVQGVEVVDKQDTLLRADELMVKVQMLPLILQKVEIDKIGLTGVTVNSAGLIDGMRIEGSLGEFLLQSHGVDLSHETVILNRVSLSDTDLHLCLNDTTESKPDTTSTPVRWKFLLHKLSLNNISFAMQMPMDSLDLQARIGKANISDGEVDLGKDIYRLTLLKLSDSEVHYNSGSGVAAKGFDPSHIGVRNVNIELESLKYHGPEMAAIIKKLTLDERSGLSITSLTGSLQSDSASIRIPSISLKTPYSYLNCSALADWSTVYKPETGRLSFRLDADFGKEDMMLLTGHLSDDFSRSYPYRPIILRADLDGNMQMLNLNELRAELPGAFRLSAEGRAEALLDSLNRAADIKLEARTGNLDFLLTLMDESSRQTLAIPHDMMLDGTAQMRGATYDTDLIFREDNSKIELAATFDSRDEKYDVHFAVDSLMMTDFLPKDSLYGLTASATLKGQGLDVFSSHTRIEAGVKVDDFSYAAYDLSDISLSANLVDSRAILSLDSHNPLLDMRTRLNALLHKDKIDAQLELNLENADLYRMRLTETPFDLALNFHLTATTDLKDVYRFDGSINDIRMQVEKGAFQPKDIYLDGATARDSTSASISAGDLKISLAAAGGLERLLAESDALTKELDEQLATRRLNQTELRKYFPTLCLRISAGTDNPISNTLTGFARIDFEELLVDVDTSPEEGINGESHIYALSMDSLQLDTIHLNLLQDTTGIKIAAGITNGPGNKQIVFRALADGIIGNDRAQLLLKYFNEQGEQGVLLGIRAVMRREGVSFHFFPETPTIVFRPFNLNKRNFIYVGADQHIRANVSLLDSAGTGLKLYSLPADTTVLQDMAVEIRRIELSDICEIVPYMPKISGMFTAEAHLVQTEQSFQLASDLQVEKLVYEENEIGNIELGAVYLPGDDDDHHLDAHLSHDGTEVLTVGGVYHTSGNGLLDADVNVQDFPLRLANGFIPDQMVRLMGNLDGEMVVKGELSKPVLNGQLVLDSVAGDVRQYGVRFRMDSKPIRLENSKLIFDKYNIYTRGNNPFTINGSVDMADFSAMTANLRLRAKNYELINASKTKESLVYGKVFVDIFSTVKGPLDALKMRGNINLLGNTNVTYVLKDSPLTAAQDRLGELVTFVNFNDTTQVEEEEVPAVSLGGMDMLMVVHIDQAARVNAELNPDGSDYIRLEGGGDLSLQYTEYSGLQLTGRYTLTSGKMKYALMVGLSREFTIQNGSYVDFSGNPMDPLLNITAVYKNRTSVTEGDTQRMVTFNASIVIKNTLENLSVSFNLDAPEDATIQNELAAMSDEERSRLAVTMIAIGIYQGGGGSGGFNMGGSMNSLLNSAIQGITNNIKAVDISLGVESSDGSNGSSHTDYSYQISKRFWNDRFNIIIGGKISTGEDVQQGQQTFIDNISIEYRLDNSGTRYVKLFHDKNYDSILDGEITETGIGVVLRKKMNRMSELFIFRRDKKNTDKRERSK